MTKTWRSNDIRARPSSEHLLTRDRPSMRVSATISSPYSKRRSWTCVQRGGWHLAVSHVLFNHMKFNWITIPSCITNTTDNMSRFITCKIHIYRGTYMLYDCHVWPRSFLSSSTQELRESKQIHKEKVKSAKSLNHGFTLHRQNIIVLIIFCSKKGGKICPLHTTI